MQKITDARSSDVRPFIDSIEDLNHLHNEPVMLVGDEDAIYVLPVDEKAETDEPDTV